MNTKKLAIVTGVGPGTGAAIVRRLVEDGFRVAMIARNEERLTALAKELPDTYIFPTDVADIEQLELALDRIKSQLGDAAVLVHNAVGGTFGSFLEIDPKALTNNFETNVVSLLHLARHLSPAMIEKAKARSSSPAIPPRYAEKPLLPVSPLPGSTAHLERVDCPRVGAERHPCRLRGHRCCDRCGMDAQDAPDCT